MSPSCRFPLRIAWPKSTGRLWWYRGLRSRAIGCCGVAMITSADNRAWACDVAIPDLPRAGLPAPSVVRPAKIACIEPARVLRRAGRVEDAIARAVMHQVRSFLPGA